MTGNRIDEIRAKWRELQGGEDYSSDSSWWKDDDIAFLLAEVERLTKEYAGLLRCLQTANDVSDEWEARMRESDARRDKLAAALDAVVCLFDEGEPLGGLESATVNAAREALVECNVARKVRDDEVRGG